MTTVALSPLAGVGWQFFDNNGAGTTTQVATYTSSNGSVANSNPIVLDASGRTTNEVWLTQGTTYKFVLQTSSAVQIWSNDNISGINDFSSLNAVSGASLIGFKQGNSSSYYTGASNRTVASKLQESVSVLDFGADPTGTNDCTTAIQNATNTGQPVFFPAGTYKMLSSVTYTGTVVWYGVGAESIIKNDSTVINVTSGSNSSIDNLYLQSITWPSIISRNTTTWATNPTPYTSSAGSHAGYQPTVNDSDLSPTPTYTTIGPVIYFQQNATNISVSRIYGLFVTINVYDAIYSTVRDCTFQGGAGIGGIVFWNINNQQGERNSAINNNITYASYSGITFARNFDGIAQGNIISYCGESGIKTYQGTISGTDARCYHMQFIGNTSMYQYYDGFDFSSDYPHTGTIDSRHQIIGNMTYGNHGAGFYADGLNNQFIDNNARNCQSTGMALDFNNSIISNNYVYGCNASNTASGIHQISVNYNLNTISNNYIDQTSAITNGYAIYATGNNVVSNNQALYGTIFLGNANSVTAQTLGNVDSVYGISGSFTPTITVGSTLQTSYNLQEGFYTRVGQRIFFDITIQLSALSGTGNVVINLANMPDATARGSGIYGATGAILGQNCSYTGVLTWFINDGTNYISLVTDTNGTQTYITNSSISSSSKFYISGSYLASQ